MDWKAHIKNLMAAGVSVVAIAKACGLSASAIYEILSGRTKRPSYDAGVKLASLDPKTFGHAPKPRRIDTPEAVERALHVPRAAPEAAPEAAPVDEEQAPDVEADDPIEPGELDMVEPYTDTTDYDPDIDRIGPLEEVA